MVAQQPKKICGILKGRVDGTFGGTERRRDNRNLQKKTMRRNGVQDAISAKNGN